MKALFFGLGAIGQRHLRNLRAALGESVDISAYRARGLPLVVLEGMKIEADSSPEQKYNVRVFHDADEALAQKPDVVFICNPSHLHGEIALAAARCGAHLFIEKPIAHDLETMSELLQIVEQKQLVSFVGYQMRFHPGVQLLRRALQSNAIGRPISAHFEVGEYLPGWHPYEDYRQMYAARREQGGGVILSQIHELDLILWFFGLPRAAWCVGGQLSDLEVDVEDVASTLFHCQVEGRTIPVTVRQDYVQRPPRRHIQIVGTTGKLELDFHQPLYQHFDGAGALVQRETFAGFERNQMFAEEMQHFLACVRGEELPLISAHNGFESLRMALAAKESLETGEVVTLQ